MKNYAKGLGYSSNSLTNDLNKAAGKKTSFTIRVNDAWRKAKEDDPSITHRMTFTEFTKQFRKEERKKK